MPAPIVNDPTRELGYLAKRNGVMLGFKELVAHPVGHGIEHASGTITNGISSAIESAITPLLGREMAGNLGWVAGAMGGTLAGIGTIGLVAAISAGLTQMDFNHKKDSLKELYKEEIAARLKKSPANVTVEDLVTFAKHNSTVDEVLKRNGKQRNFSVGISFVASLAALAMVASVITPFVLAPLALTGAGISTGAWLGGIAISMVSSLFTYNVVKEPLHAVANKLFDLDDKITHDYIDTIEKKLIAGKSITRVEVLGAFISAKPELEKFIVSEYGKNFDDLSADDKSRSAMLLNTMFPLDKLTLDINSGRVNPTELAFAVEGEISGVNHKKTAEVQKPVEASQLRSTVNRIGKVISMMRRRRPGEISDVYVSDINEAVTAATEKYAATASAAAPAQASALVPGFAKRLNLSKRDPTISFVEKVELSSAEQGAQLQQG